MWALEGAGHFIDLQFCPHIVMRILSLSLFTLLFAVAASPSFAQSNAFRASHAHLSAGAGVFTYYGPLNLLDTNSRSVINRDVGVVFTGSFPIVTNTLYFRGLVGLTNFDTAEERAVLVRPEQNEFLYNQVLWFEPEVVWTPTVGYHRLLPYLYTGFGVMWAAPFETRTSRAINPNAPGPDRTAFFIPLGLGLSFGLTRTLDLYLDASYRLNLNYVMQNDAGYNSHSTSFLSGGLRYALPFGRTRVLAVAESEPLPVVPVYVPPTTPTAGVAGANLTAQEVFYTEQSSALLTEPCPITELNSIYFDVGSIQLDQEAQRRLTENVALLNQYPTCRIVIEAFVDAAEVGNARFAANLDEQRVQSVYQFYLDRGMAADRMCAFAMGQGFPNCDKEDPDMGCFRNRVVQTLPKDCVDYYNNR